MNAKLVRESLNKKTTFNLMEEDQYTISKNVHPPSNKIGDGAPYDHNIKMRRLTSDEKNQLLHHPQIKRDNIDLNQDVAFRYISKTNNQDYYESFSYSTINDVVIPEDAYAANVIGNMNYTDAYAEQELVKDAKFANESFNGNSLFEKIQLSQSFLENVNRELGEDRDNPMSIWQKVARQFLKNPIFLGFEDESLPNNFKAEQNSIIKNRGKIIDSGSVPTKDNFNNPLTIYYRLYKGWVIYLWEKEGDSPYIYAEESVIDISEEDYKENEYSYDSIDLYHEEEMANEIIRLKNEIEQLKKKIR